jgi:predicted transcriptional regulator
MIDADSGRIMDMIESRETEIVAEWLGKYPNVQIVSRDGSAAYAAAITKGLPKAVQVSDRFHLLQHICDIANKCFQRVFQGRIAIPVTSESERMRQILSLGTKDEKVRLVKTLSRQGRSADEIEAMTGMADETVKKYLRMGDSHISAEQRQTVRGKDHDDAVQKAQERADLVRQMRSEGISISAIARKTGFTCNTVKVYLSGGFTPVNGHYGSRREGKLECFRDSVLQMRAQGKTYAQIHETILMQGYAGTQDAIRGFVSKERRVANDLHDRFGPTELIEKKWIVKLLYKPLRKIPALSREQFAAVLKTYPSARDIFRFVYRFKGIVKMRDIKRLKKWIDDATALDIDEMKSFANGLRNDFSAVSNAFLYDYNNGMAEGTVNKVKVFKRIMYGRCSFRLLKSKILKSESLRFNLL